MQHRFTRNKRGPHYVYRLFKGASTLYIDQGNGARMSRQMCEHSCSGEIIGIYATEEQAFDSAERLRRKYNMKYLGAPVDNLLVSDRPLSHERIRTTVEWYLRYLRSNTAESLRELQDLHKCNTEESLAAKMIADTIVLDL